MEFLITVLTRHHIALTQVYPHDATCRNLLTMPLVPAMSRATHVLKSPHIATWPISLSTIKHGNGSNPMRN